MTKERRKSQRMAVKMTVDLMLASESGEVFAGQWLRRVGVEEYGERVFARLSYGEQRSSSFGPFQISGHADSG